MKSALRWIVLGLPIAIGYVVGFVRIGLLVGQKRAVLHIEKFNQWCGK